MVHVHNGDPARGAVCSHLCTDAVLIALGLQTRRTDKIVGTPVVTREGLTHKEAMRRGFAARAIRTCTIAPVPKANFEQSDERRLAAIAFAESIVRVSK